MSPHQSSWTCPDYFNTTPPGRLCRYCEWRDICERDGFRPVGETDTVVTAAIEHYGAVLTAVETLEKEEGGM